MNICIKCKHCDSRYLCKLEPADEKVHCAISTVSGNIRIKRDSLDQVGWGGPYYDRLLRRCNQKNTDGQCRDFEKRTWWRFW